MEYDIARLSWTDFVERKKSADLVIVPNGAVEVYGPQLPMGADFLVAKALARLVAERTGGLVAPSIEFGESSSLVGFPGTVTLSKSTLQAVFDELFTQLVASGFRRFLFISGHGGNVDTVTYLAKKYSREKDIRCAQIDWWRFAAGNDKGIFQEKGAMCHGHASECGTSVFLHLYPELVNRDRLVREEPPAEKATKYPDIIQYPRFEDKTRSGVIGDATLATAEKGREIVERCVGRIVSFISDEL